MKTKSKSFSVILPVLVSALVSVSSQAQVNKLTFEQALTLSSPAIAVQVDRVDLKIDKASNSWKESISKRDIKRCSLSMRIEGRDIAISNPILGEHYFGSMELNCSSFKTKFSRVLFLGMRNCVESETIVDRDYCTLVALAMRKESDLSAANGDLIRNDKDKRTFMRVSSEKAEKNVRDLGLVPEGLNVDTIDSFQLFEFSIGKTGSEFFIPGTNQLASFSGGVNNYLTMTDTSRDAALATKVDASLGALESMVHEIESSAKPKDVLDAKMTELLGKFSATTKDLLAIISPVEYFGREKRLKSIEANIVELSHTYYPSTVSDRDSFVRSFASKSDEYRRVSEYFNWREWTVDYSNLVAPVSSRNEVLRRNPRPVVPVTISPVPTQGSVGGSPKPGVTGGSTSFEQMVLAGKMQSLPAGTKLTLIRDLIIMPNSWQTEVGQIDGSRACLLSLTQTDTAGRVIPAGTVLSVSYAQSDRYHAVTVSVNNGNFNQISCSSGDEEITVGKFLTALSGSFQFQIPAPTVMRQ